MMRPGRPFPPLEEGEGGNSRSELLMKRRNIV